VEAPERPRAAVETSPERVYPGGHVSPASFSLHEGDYGANGVPVLSVRAVHGVDSRLAFAVVEVPAAGYVKCVSVHDGREELHPLAPDKASAALWAAQSV
jgi:hypothetical protein